MNDVILVRIVDKFRLAMMTGGVDFSGSPGGVTSATHGEAELEDTVKALRDTGAHAQAGGRDPISLTAGRKFREIRPLSERLVLFQRFKATGGRFGDAC